MMGVFSGTKVLVTGGAGFVGSNLVRRLLAEDVQTVWVVDNLLSAERDNLPTDPRVRLVIGSIADDQVLSEIKDDFNYIFHLCTYHGNQSSIHDPIADHDNNTITSLKLFNHIRNFKMVEKIVYAGAGCAVAEKTFGVAKPTQESDNVAIDGDSPYSLSKIFGEFYGKYFFKQYGTPIVRARFQNVYGPGEVLGAGRWRGTPATVWRNVTPTFIWKALTSQPLTIENEGIATRDFIYVDDIVEGLVRLALKGKPPEAYNLATGEETSIKKLATLINEMTKNPTPVTFLPKRDWDHSGTRFGSTEKAETVLGFSAQISIEDGLKRTVAWTLTHRERIKQCIAQHSDQMSNEANSRIKNV
jgi:UDP-glucose 4-epimerase